ncbi:hypothetical protein LQ236_001405 [Nitrospina gracilis]|uniref:eCIS core domain-containing protein n=2 Tax=Nitrospina TaxID=35800 RepID=UPI001F44EDD1|nr:DUF4157 domain-containing protein [Nitrospina sp. Nb-3]MCF8723385.1 hypothetical protein [Nitrospina sp. Nb-3]
METTKAPVRKKSTASSSKKNASIEYNPAAAVQKKSLHRALKGDAGGNAVPVGPVSDKYEQEADRVADSVMRMPDPAVRSMNPAVGSNSQVQRSETPSASPEEMKEELQPEAAQPEEKKKDPEVLKKSLLQRTTPEDASIPDEKQEDKEMEEAEARVQRQEAEGGGGQEEVGGGEGAGSEEEIAQQEAEAQGEAGEPVSEEEPETWPEPEPGEVESIEKVQRKSNGGGMTHVADPGTNARIQSPSGGRPLSSGLRSFVEPRLNQDFSNVRVHDAQQDREDATSLQARAFTYGNHIWVGKNESADDRRLMTHELVHVVQQGGGVKRKPAPEISKAPKRVQGGWWDDVKAAGSAFVEAVADPAEALRKAKDALLSKASEFVQEVPGFKLLTVILGKNPITDKTVDRNANNLIEGFLEFVPGGTKMFQNLKESGALQKAYDWLQEQLKKLNLGWSVIKGLFRKAWDAVSLSDIANPFGIFDKLKRIFMPPLIRIKNFAVAVGEKIIEFVFEGAMKLAGPLAQKVVGVFKQGKDVFSTIINDPVQFLKNLLSSVKGGFGQFKDNIVEHLKKGLFGWLFGALEGAGLTLPKKFDLKGILSITLQVLGLTYARVRTKLVKVIGEKRVTYIEKAIEVVKILVTEGLAGVWKKLLGWIGSLKEIVIAQIRNWVITQIVKAAVKKLVSLFSPVGAIIQAILTTYDVIVFFIERIKQIIAVVESIFQSIGKIARGQLGEAKNFVEQTLSRTVPVVISFLASFAGLGGISKKIKAIIKSIQKKVDTAISKLVNFIVGKAKALFGKAKAAAGKVKQWWSERKTFTVGKKKHSMFFEGADIMVQSEKKSLGKFLKDAKTQLDQLQAGQKGADKDDLGRLSKIYGKADLLYAQLKSARDKTMSAARKGEGDAPTKDEEKKYTELRDAVATLMGTLSSEGGSTAEPTKVSYGGLEHGQLGKSATANPLSIKGEAGSEPSSAVNTDIWNAVSQRKESGRSFYIRGHLLNARLHGPGDKKENITPITEPANKQHSREAEEKVKDVVWNRKGDKGKDENSEGVAVYYKVTAVYDGGNKTTADKLIKEVDTTDKYDSQTGRDTAKHILENEKKLPTALKVEAYRLDDNKTPIKVTASIPSKMPDALPGVESARPTPVNLSVDDAATIHANTDIGMAKAKLIAASRAADGYLWWESKSAADGGATDGKHTAIESIPGIGSKTIEKLKSMPWVKLRK